MTYLEKLKIDAKNIIRANLIASPEEMEKTVNLLYDNSFGSSYYTSNPSELEKTLKEFVSKYGHYVSYEFDDEEEIKF